MNRTMVILFNKSGSLFPICDLHGYFYLVKMFKKYVDLLFRRTKILISALSRKFQDSKNFKTGTKNRSTQRDAKPRFE